MKVHIDGDMFLLWDQSLHTYGGMSYVSNEAYTCMLIRCW